MGYVVGLVIGSFNRLMNDLEESLTRMFFLGGCAFKPVF